MTSYLTNTRIIFSNLENVNYEVYHNKVCRQFRQHLSEINEVTVEANRQYLAALRKARNEEINTVANVVELAPGVLEQIEVGGCDFQIETLFALCDYYDADLKSVVGIGELMSIRLN